MGWGIRLMDVKLNLFVVIWTHTGYRAKWKGFPRENNLKRPQMNARRRKLSLVEIRVKFIVKVCLLGNKKEKL